MFIPPRPLVADRLRLSREQYRDEYLQSDHWREQRAAALERAGHRCQVCNAGKQLDVHHRTYERLGCELPADLTVLCRSCHETFHAAKRAAAAPSAPAKKPAPEQQPRLMGKKAQRRERQRERERANRSGAHKQSMEAMQRRNAERPLRPLDAEAAAKQLNAEIAARKKAAKAPYHKPFRPEPGGGFPLKVIRADGTVELPADRQALTESSRPARAPGRNRRSTRK